VDAAPRRVGERDQGRVGAQRRAQAGRHEGHAVAGRHQRDLGHEIAAAAVELEDEPVP